MSQPSAQRRPLHFRNRAAATYRRLFRSGPVTLSLLLLLPLAAAATDLNDYAVQPGYSLQVDSSGFLLPTSMAFVPEPGPEPDAPLYFVAELHGTVRVVTRDRRVLEFARVEADRGQTPDLSGDSQSGLAGLCLDPLRGYVFVTYTEADDGGVLRNRLVRFSTAPGRFALQPAESRHLDAPLLPFQSAPAHQIGNCVVDGDQLYVGVGDGGNPRSASDPSVLLGKILCFHVEGGPCRHNPFAQTSTGSEEYPPEAYVYAYGFRNPFGLEIVDGALYSAENGVEVDRLVEVERGADHLWRGTDQSFAAAADLVFTPVVSPVQLDYLPPSATAVDESRRGHFVAATYGGKKTNSGLVLFAPDRSGKSRPVPEFLLEYVGGQGRQHLGAVALGPDAIYFAPMVPGEDGTSDVLALRYQPTAAHGSVVLHRPGLESAGDLGPLAARGCVSCHTIAGQGGGIGPTLDRFAIDWRLNKRLNSREYEAQVKRLETLDTPLAVRWREAREEVLEARGVERTWVWLKYFLQEPRFDRPETQMPNLGIGEGEAERLRAQLFSVLGIRAESPTLWERGLSFVSRNREPLLLGGAAGAVGALLLLAMSITLGTTLLRIRTSSTENSHRDRGTAATQR